MVSLNECRPILEITKALKEQLPQLLGSAFEGDPPAMKMQPPEEHDETLNNFLMYIEEAVCQFRICLDEKGSQLKVPPQDGRRPTRPNEAQLPVADDSDDEEADSHPWTRSELRERVQNALQRRKKGKNPHRHGTGQDQAE